MFGLLALGLLLGHVHPDHTLGVGPTDTPTFADDHAHHEHTPGALVDPAPCVGCRSFDEKTIAATRGPYVVPVDLVICALPERSDGARRAPFSGLPATRAPPIA